jgi:hypothetical protein
MGEVINLRQFRKARERAEAEAEARTNRAKFGRTKAQRVRDADEEARREQLLDQARREVAGDTEDDPSSSNPTGGPAVEPDPPGGPAADTDKAG